MDYLRFKNWKNSHATEMQDLTFAKPDDYFIFIRFSGQTSYEFDSKQVLFAESIEEVLGYIRHIFIYDILNDAVDDLEFDIKTPFDDRQKDAILLFNYWFMSGKITAENLDYIKLKEFCNDFNSDFSFGRDLEYEIEVLNGADSLREFLIKRYSNIDDFDSRRLSNICSKELFAGKLLKDFLDEIWKNPRF